jgi:hypothetical protein
MLVADACHPKADLAGCRKVAQHLLKPHQVRGDEPEQIHPEPFESARGDSVHQEDFGSPH